MGAVLHERVEVGDHCIIGSGCVVTANQVIPPGKLVLGVPGKIVGDVTPEMSKAKIFGTKLYQNLPRRHKATMKLIGSMCNIAGLTPGPPRRCLLTFLRDPFQTDYSKGCRQLKPWKRA
jgi:acyl-[acyl carrier protein]--UDP-N-acetylglucosamine O-acyltransferase